MIFSDVLQNSNMDSTRLRQESPLGSSVKSHRAKSKIGKTCNAELLSVSLPNKLLSGNQIWSWKIHHQVILHDLASKLFLIPPFI